MMADTFPWTIDLAPRKLLLSDEFAEALSMEEYVQNAYEASLARMPRLEGETGLNAKRREISWLNLQWFMETLLNRMDRTSRSVRPDSPRPLCRLPDRGISLQCPVGNEGKKRRD